MKPRSIAYPGTQVYKFYVCVISRLSGLPVASVPVGFHINKVNKSADEKGEA